VGYADAHFRDTPIANSAAMRLPRRAGSAQIPTERIVLRPNSDRPLLKFRVKMIPRRPSDWLFEPCSRNQEQRQLLRRKVRALCRGTTSRVRRASAVASAGRSSAHCGQISGTPDGDAGGLRVRRVCAQRPEKPSFSIWRTSCHHTKDADLHWRRNLARPRRRTSG